MPVRDSDGIVQGVAQGKTHGEWEATSQGNTLSGEGVVTISVAGQEMTMDMSWEGKRLGSCE